MSKNLKEIQAEIETVKQEIMALGIMRPGSISLQTRQNGKQYYQLSYTFQKKGRTEYIRPEFKEQVDLQNEQFRKFKALSDALIQLNIDYSRLEMELGKQPLEGTRK